MKQSIGLIVLQFLGIALGLVSVFWVAGSIPPELFAIVGIHGIITSIVVVFSNTGLETYAIRNVLTWNESGDYSQIQQIITQAVVLRIITSLILFVFVISYAYYVSKFKFDGQHLSLFVLMGFFAVFAAINNTIVLILRAFNKYFIAAFVQFSINIFGRFLALLLFIKYGFSVYIHTIILLPFIVTVPIFFMIKKWFVLNKNLTTNEIKKNLLTSKSFAASSYISYLFNHFDQFVVSILLKPDFLGAYTIAKRLFSIGKSFLENIFDPMAQNLVRYKKKKTILEKEIQRIFRIRNIFLLISIFCFFSGVVFLDDIIHLLRLNRYPHLLYFLISIYIGLTFSILMKIKYQVITLFLKPSYYLMLTIIHGFFSILSFFILISLKEELVFLNLAITNIILLIVTSHIYSKEKNVIIGNAT